MSSSVGLYLCSGSTPVSLVVVVYVFHDVLVTAFEPRLFLSHTKTVICFVQQTDQPVFKDSSLTLEHRNGLQWVFALLSDILSNR